MAILNRTTLKSFYESGDKPTQAQFAALIDSNLNLDEDQSLLGLREYNAAHTYELGDSVIYNAAIYQCIVASSSGTFNPSYWTEVSGTIQGAIVYKGTWDAATNVPDLPAATPSLGDYYVISVAGTTNLDGITDWQLGDWAIFNGTAWEKIDNTDLITNGENVAGTGVGIFKVKTGTNLQFKKIQNSDGSISVIEDGSSSFIDFLINFDDESSATDRAWSAGKISTELALKADKVVEAVVNDFASLDGAGNLLDSGYSAASFLASTSTAVDIPVTPEGNVSALEVQSAIEQLDTIKEAANPNIQAHIVDFDNPHNTTKSQVGLGNVTNEQQLSQKEYQEAEAEQTTTSVHPTLATGLSFNFTPPVEADYLIEWYFEMAKDTSSTMTLFGELKIDGTAIGTTQPRLTMSNQWVAISGFKQETLTTSTHPITLNFAKMTGGSGSAKIRRMRVKITKV